MRANHWENPIKLAITDVEYHPNSPRAHLVLAEIYEYYSVNEENKELRNEYYNKALTYFSNALKLEPNSTSAHIGILFLNLQNGIFYSEEEFNTLLAHLKFSRIDASSSNALQHLTDCVLNGKCAISPDQYILLFNTVLDNVNLSPNIKAILLINLSRYYTNILADYITAERLIRESIILDKSKYGYRLDLILTLIKQNRLDDAKIELNKLSREDKYKTLSSAINFWEHYITNAEKDNKNI